MAKTPKTAKGNLALRLNAIRQFHIYLSVFVAPLLLFWTITGALQVFRIPDANPPDSVIIKLASVHRNSTYVGKAPPAPKAAPAPGEHAAPAAPKPPKAPPKPATTALKWFMAIVSVILSISTLLGVWMALAYHRRKLLLVGVFIAGAVIPVLLLVAAA